MAQRLKRYLKNIERLKPSETVNLSKTEKINGP